jgi:hypothetical protein
MQQFHEVGGHVFRREGKRSGPVWYANYRLPDGRQVQRLRDVELWRSALRAELSTRSKNQLLTELHGIFKRAEKVWGLPSNPVEEVELLRERPRVDFEVYSPEEVLALVRWAAKEQDAGGMAQERQQHRAA